MLLGCTMHHKNQAENVALEKCGTEKQDFTVSIIAVTRVSTAHRLRFSFGMSQDKTKNTSKIGASVVPKERRQ